MITPPPDPADPAGSGASSARTVTQEQVTHAVLQLRERPGQAPVELVRAVLRAFDLTVTREEKRTESPVLPNTPEAAAGMTTVADCGPKPAYDP